MVRNSVYFGDKKIKKNSFLEEKITFKIDDIDVNRILVSKIDSCGKKSHLNTLLDIVTKMSLDNYA